MESLKKAAQADNNLPSGKHVNFRIRHKLFLTILLTSSMVAFGLFIFLQWSFDRGFFNYISRETLSGLSDFGTMVTGYYNKQTGWASLKNNQGLWLELHGDLLERYRRNGVQDKEKGGRLPPPPPPHDPEWIGSRVVLLDAEKQHIIGGPPNRADLPPILQPIVHENSMIGYLGLFPARELMDAGDLHFVEQQTEAFGLIALVTLGVSILLTFPVTIHLLRPIINLTEGTQKLIGGKYATRIPVTTKDELGHLSEHFNILAMTLEKNEKTRQRLIADISHELRTPLAVVRGELEALQDGIRQLDQDTLNPLHSEIMHMERLVNDLYELSMSDIGALTYKKLMIDPVGILSGTIELFEQRITEQDLTMKLSIPEQTGVVILGDPDRIQQLFTNILENSLRYTDCPGVVEISVKETNSGVTILFQDSAPGVEPEQLPLLFERLYRTDPSRKRAGSGAGLGLSICSNIVEAHQGSITSYVSPHGGLGIKIELPFPQA